MYKEYSSTTNIFDKNGSVVPFGWSKEPVFNFNKMNNTASILRSRERDSYCIMNSHLLFSFSIANYGLYGEINGMLIDFDTFSIGSRNVRKLLPQIKFKMPESSLFGDVAYNDNQIGIKFSKAGNKRYLKCEYLNFDNNRNLYFNIEIEENNTESINIAVPFEDSKTSFFTKRFLPQMRATGIVRFGGEEYNLDKEYTTAILDWTRMSVPSKFRYSQLVAEGNIKNSIVTVHFSGGISESSEGIENCIFVDGRIIKLSSVKAKGHRNDIRSTWSFQDKDGNIYIEFVPSTKGGGNLNTKNSKGNVIYGNIYGHIVGDKGKIIKIDGFDSLLMTSTI